MDNQVYAGADGKWTCHNSPFDTMPCSHQEALDLAVEIGNKAKGEWKTVLTYKDTVNLGLAMRILQSYYAIYNPNNSGKDFSKAPTVDRPGAH